MKKWIQEHLETISEEKVDAKIKSWRNAQIFKSMWNQRANWYRGIGTSELCETILRDVGLEVDVLNVYKTDDNWSFPLLDPATKEIVKGRLKCVTVCHFSTDTTCLSFENSHFLRPQRFVDEFTLEETNSRLSNSDASMINRKKRPSSSADLRTDDQKPAKRQRLERFLSQTSIDSGMDTSGYVSSQATTESDDVQMYEEKEQLTIALPGNYEGDGETVHTAMSAPISEQRMVFLEFVLCHRHHFFFQKRNIQINQSRMRKFHFLVFQYRSLWANRQTSKMLKFKKSVESCRASRQV